MQTQVIKVDAKEADMIQAWLDSNQPIPDVGLTETIKIYTAVFMVDFEVNIKVCNTEIGPYVDVVLFEAGNEILCLEVRYTLLGTYYFRDTTDVYKVVIEKGEDK